MNGEIWHLQKSDWILAEVLNDCNFCAVVSVICFFLITFRFRVMFTYYLMHLLPKIDLCRHVLFLFPNGQDRLYVTICGHLCLKRKPMQMWAETVSLTGCSQWAKANTKVTLVTNGIPAILIVYNNDHQTGMKETLLLSRWEPGRIGVSLQAHSHWGVVEA